MIKVNEKHSELIKQKNSEIDMQLFLIADKHKISLLIGDKETKMSLEEQAVKLNEQKR